MSVFHSFSPSWLGSVHHCSFILSRFWSNVGMMCWCSSSSSRTSTSVFNLLLHNESSDGLNNRLHTHIGVHRRSCGYHRVWTQSVSWSSLLFFSLLHFPAWWILIFWFRKIHLDYTSRLSKVNYIPRRFRSNCDRPWAPRHFLLSNFIVWF